MDTIHLAPDRPAPDLRGDPHEADPHGAERDDPHCLDGHVLQDLLHPTPWHRLAVIGDSIAAGVGDPVDGYADVSWADRLAAALGGPSRQLEYVNLGVRELRAAEIRTAQLPVALRFHPDLVVVSAGANDMLRRSFDAAYVRRELDAIIGTLTESGALVVTFGLLDLSRTTFVPDGMRAELRDRLERLNAATREITDRHDGVHVDFFAHPALGDDLFSADMIHPNRRGHACIATSVSIALSGRGARVRTRQRHGVR